MKTRLINKLNQVLLLRNHLKTLSKEYTLNHMKKYSFSYSNLTISLKKMMARQSISSHSI